MLRMFSVSVEREKSIMEPPKLSAISCQLSARKEGLINGE
jgi:hypothetical protein